MARIRKNNIVNMPKTDINSSPLSAHAPITDDDIARRAYEIYLRRGGTHGADLDDWLQAERELRAVSVERRA